MNKEEAKHIVQAELESYRAKPYSELVQMIDAESVTGEFIGPSGKRYQIEIQAFWDDKSNGNIRVLGAIDDGGLRALVPLTDSFIKSPSNEFVGE
ncbi:MAG: hypothetical protein WBC05_04310 [Sedimentisphaerales bacterium]